MPEHYKVMQGDCLSSIALEHGFFWKTLWNHADNAALKQKRKNPNILKAGDTLYVPNLTPKEESGATEQKHRFELQGVPVKLRLRIMELPRLDLSNQGDSQSGPQENPQKNPNQKQPAQISQTKEPRADLPYVLHIEGASFIGTTNSDGILEHAIPPNAQEGQLVLDPGTPNELIIPLKLGSLEPVEEIAGVQARLNNLGFSCGPVDGVLGPRTKTALKSFQESTGLKASGDLDKATESKLREAHDSK